MKFSALRRNVANWPAYIRFRLGLNKANPIPFVLRPVPIKLDMLTSMKPLFNEIFLKEVYKPALAQLKTDEPVILDVGGNMGYFALYSFLKKPRARVFSFEPVPVNFTYLSRHAELNPDLKWTFYNSAVSNQAGMFDFFYNKACSPEGVDISGSLFSSDRILSVQQNHERIEVPVLSLADWMSEHSIEQCDLLKLDCEGAEYAILYSMPEHLLRKIVSIVADVHPMSGENENIEALAGFLREKGFEVNTVNQELMYAHRRQA